MNGTLVAHQNRINRSRLKSVRKRTSKIISLDESSSSWFFRVKYLHVFYDHIISYFLIAQAYPEKKSSRVLLSSEYGMYTVLVGIELAEILQILCR